MHAVAMTMGLIDTSPSSNTAVALADEARHKRIHL